MTQPGRKLKTSSGYYAFMPDPLPPQLRWTPDLVRTLSNADRAIGKLAGEGRRLPNPHVLMRPFIAREAVLSSRIEGTHATLGELLAADAGAILKKSPADLQEVGNYVAALEFGLHRLKKDHLTFDLILDLHYNLMNGVRGGAAHPGMIRSSQNWVGLPGSTAFEASYVPPPPEKLNELMGDLAAFMTQKALPPLVSAALLHYQFEAIHPFLDGNGRLGRLLITLFLVDRAILPTPLLYLSAFFEASRAEYYRCLRAVTEEGDWNRWLQYFLGGIALQSNDALNRASRIVDLLDQWRVLAAEFPGSTPVSLLNLLAGNPFVTIPGVSEKLGVARSTASRAIEYLVRQGILEQTGSRKRDRSWLAPALLRILEEPALLYSSDTLSTPVE
ncbi:MAG: Fic family protein [Candidatus Aegiribacteria sp.]|nr:Fic family protein [Candidatus Aegiribacteria sp.]